uniref:SNF1-related protein kinase regulatory subunit gamma-1-like n=1 Tax=Anthurium amnicola TaxID=1678845 RepID=A0A1D1YRY1_9ARAE
MAHQTDTVSKIPDCDAYFEAIQSRKKLPYSLQKSLTSAFAQIPVSSFPEVPGGKVIEIPADTLITDAVQILSKHNITAAPVINPEAGSSLDWKHRYLGILDYSAIILWVLENAELAALALTTGSATAAGVGAGAVGALGALALGTAGSAAVVGLTVAAVGAAVAGGMAAEKGVGKDAPTAADHLGEDFYKVLIEEEPFKSTKVESIVKTFRWAPFLPVGSDSSMLTVLLLLSKYRLRNVPVVEVGIPSVRNFITQSAIVKGLQQCKGRDWFDCISSRPLSDFGLPFMSYDEVISVRSDELILEAFKHMKDNRIGGLPVIEGPKRKIVGSVSIRDIRFLLLRPELFSSYRKLTVMDFLRTIASTSSDSGGAGVSLPVTCAPDASLGSIIDTLASRAVHRVYIVEGEDDEVIGVVTLRDVISCFIFEPPNLFDNYFGFAVKELQNHRDQSKVADE